MKLFLLLKHRFDRLLFNLNFANFDPTICWMTFSRVLFTRTAFLSIRWVLNLNYGASLMAFKYGLKFMFVLFCQLYVSFCSFCFSSVWSLLKKPRWKGFTNRLKRK
jgi:hypothetical protein